MVELKKNKRIYAMKVIKKELVTDDEDIDWVQTEKHVFETASNHPFLVGLHSCFQVGFRFRRCSPHRLIGELHYRKLQLLSYHFHSHRRRRGCFS